VRRLQRRAAADAARAHAWPALAILRPCEGLDPGLHDNLLSCVTASYGGTREVWVLVPSESDPAHAVAQAVRAEALARAPGVPVHVVITAIETPANRKVAQLMVARPSPEATVVVVADSDICFDERTLPCLIAVLEADPKAGASSSPMIEVRPETAGDRASAALLSSTPHGFLCLAGLAERSGGAHVLCGALIACRRSVLDEVGGFAALEQFLGEDFELARRLHERGYAIPHSSAPAPVTDHGRSLGQVVKRYARWCTVTRQQRPHLFSTYTLLLGCTPLVLALAAVVAALRPPFWWAGLVTAGGAVTARLAFAITLRRCYGLPAGPLRSLAALLAGEVLIVAGATLALGRPEVEWRGRRYHVGRGGLLSRIG
jgi:ceramide glucosyltransferase